MGKRPAKPKSGVVSSEASYQCGWCLTDEWFTQRSRHCPNCNKHTQTPSPMKGKLYCHICQKELTEIYETVYNA